MSESTPDIVHAARSVVRLHRARYHDGYGDSNVQLNAREAALPWKAVLDESLAVQARAEGLIGRNETLRDLNPEFYFVLGLPYVIADLLSNTNTTSTERVTCLNESMQWYDRFLLILDQHEALPPSLRQRFLSDTEDVALRREYKVAAWRTRKDSQRFLSRLPFLLELSNEVENYSDEDADCLKAWLIEAAVLALDQRDQVRAELELLASTHSPLQEPKESLPPVTYTVLDPAQVRQRLQQRVFRPGHALPTIPLSEVAKKEMEQDLSIGGADPEVRQYREGNLYDNSKGVSDSESSTESDEDEKRRWDDWKDAHPRGWGNKNRNIG